LRLPADFRKLLETTAMKKIKNIYWISTILFAGFMAFTAIPDILLVPEAKAFIMQLGYPEYFIPFIGVAKLLGSIALVIPGFKTIKEWAYAGLTYDLIAAVYSNLKVNGFDMGMLTMIPIFLALIVSYVYCQKYFAAKAG
jgi:uncharacterized membrane protein YphA (DoxX/SURF4 family)